MRQWISALGVTICVFSLVGPLGAMVLPTTGSGPQVSGQATTAIGAALQDQRPIVIASKPLDGRPSSSFG